MTINHPVRITQADMNITKISFFFLLPGAGEPMQRPPCCVCLLTSAEEMNQINSWMTLRPSIVRFQSFLWIFYTKNIYIYFLCMKVMVTNIPFWTCAGCCAPLICLLSPLIPFITLAHHCGGKVSILLETFQVEFTVCLFRNGACEGKLNRRKKTVNLS